MHISVFACVCVCVGLRDVGRGQGQVARWGACQRHLDHTPLSPLS